MTAGAFADDDESGETRLAAGTKQLDAPLLGLHRSTALLAAPAATHRVLDLPPTPTPALHVVVTVLLLHALTLPFNFILFITYIY